MAKNNDSMKVFKKARKATAAQSISAKAAGEGSSQVPPKRSISSSEPRRVIPTPQVHLVDPPASSAATSSQATGPPPKKQRTVEPFNVDALTLMPWVCRPTNCSLWCCASE